MSESIVFTVFVPDGAELQSPDLMNMGIYAIFKGCESYSVSGGTEFRFDQRGISKISTEQLYGLIQFGALGVECRGQIGPRFIEMTADEYAAKVPETFPESSKPGAEEGETEQMTFAEYCPFGPAISVDGKNVLVNISERAAGETCGDGTSWEEYLIWFAAYGTRILTPGAAETLRASEKYVEVVKSEPIIEESIK